MITLPSAINISKKIEFNEIGSTIFNRNNRWFDLKFLHFKH